MFRDVVSLLTAAFLAAAFSGSASAESVSVMYAGSLVNLMEHGVAPAFGKATGDTLQGVAGGSNGLANQIKAQQQHGDVFISADPKVNDDLEGAANGDWVNWYVTFAQSPLVIGFNPSSRFASELSPGMRSWRSPGSGSVAPTPASIRRAR
jgi:molybdate/tungstate transport system substrate-binding protein